MITLETEYSTPLVFEAMETIRFFAKDSSELRNSRTNQQEGLNGRLT